MLSRRELSASQVARRLARKGYEADAIEGALTKLRETRAIDDRRVALAAARTHAHIKRQGRGRVARELGALGLADDLVVEALDEVFGALDEDALLEQALDKRLRPRHDLADPAVQRRLFAALFRQGFNGQAISRALKARARKQRDGNED
jgi:SOS response regulatory protein OraA/RecX